VKPIKATINSDLFCEISPHLHTIKLNTNKISVAVNLVNLYNKLVSCNITANMVVNNDTLYLTIPIQCNEEQN